MFVGVPFCVWLYYAGKVATVVFVGVLIFWSVYLYSGATSSEIIKNSWTGERRGSGKLTRFREVNV